jgi:putative PEP-CTERM system TPR-repeat lipoprotein
MLGLGRTESARDLFTEILDAIDNDVPAQLGIVSSYLAERNFVQARATMDHVLTTSADAIDAWLLSGRMHFERRNAELAETHFDKALGLAVSQKNNIAREMGLMGLTESLLAQNKTELARESVQELTTLSPNAPGTKYLSARIAYLDQDWERAQALLQEVLQFVPDNRSAQILLGSVHLQNGNLEQAEMYLTAVVASSPNNADARNLLAQTRLRQKDTNAAQALLRPMLDADAPNAYALALAAQTSVQTGDLDEAVKYLQRRAEVSTDDPDAELDLAAAYLMADRIDDAQALLENAEFSEAGTNEFRRDILMVLSLMKSDKLDAALTEVDAVIEKWPQSTRALSLKAAVEMRVGDTDAARKNLAMAADLNPGDVLPLRLLGAIEEDEGNFQAAKDSYLKIVEYLPDDARNLMALARISQRMNDLAGARHWLERSVAADPGNLSVRKVLGQLLLALRDFEAAKGFAEETIRLSGDDADAHRILGYALLETEDFEAAQDSFREAISFDSKVPEYWLALARTEIAAGDRDGALKTINAAYVENPSDLQIATLLATVMMNNNDLDAAMIIAKELRRERPDDVAPIALEAEILARQGDLSRAAALYDSVISIENAPRFVARAYQLRDAAGLPDKRDPLTKYLEQNPLNTSVRIAVAQSYQLDGENDAAVSEYEKVLESSPEQPIALNNLAWLSMESGDARAESYARKAYAVAPDNANVIDTLGWILVQKGDVEDGLNLLKPLAEQHPGQPVYQYHLAAALAKMGDSDRARGILEAVLRDNGAFPGREEAEELLLQL